MRTLLTRVLREDSEIVQAGINWNTDQFLLHVCIKSNIFLQITVLRAESHTEHCLEVKCLCPRSKLANELHLTFNAQETLVQSLMRKQRASL